MKKIAVTGATGRIAYSLLFRIAHGDLFPKPEPMILSLYDLPGTEKVMEGIAMELEDCAFPLLQGVTIGSDVYKQFAQVDLALLIGAKPRLAGMERADLLIENGRIFVEQGKALEAMAKKDVKVLVVGNPCNTNCLIAMHHAKSIPRENFYAMTRLDQNRASNFLAKKAGVLVKNVKNVTIWGNHSITQVPDFINATIEGKKTQDVIKDSKWLEKEFIEMVQKRGAEIIRVCGKSSAASAANAIIDSVRDIYTQTPKGEWFAAAVYSNGNPYGIEENLVFGFPCHSIREEKSEIVSGLFLNSFLKEKIIVSQQELIFERACIEKELL
ncbi:MAG: malate dehydrogenase [Chlamydiales bacterium]